MDDIVTIKGLPSMNIDLEQRISYSEKQKDVLLRMREHLIDMSIQNIDRQINELISLNE
jgi:hypothetical protein